ncbi:YdcF family protein [Undibacterium pigrum]|uniref:Vancomycin permeability regulator SanA n=1 Tax=Undibacterium pigrum TaxID=401470 RepID=A0A318J9B5_9BURK|nr:YdcF family protein [Undibacterium pigrum]PXX44932.1 vancomycin permeability regulator SanA [Undibacterium pigrum]
MPYTLQKKIKQFSLALLICLLFMAAAISTLGLRDQIVVADLAIVPGNTVNPDGKPSDRLRGRLNAALRLYMAQKCKAILVSGGTGEEGHDEAEVMKNYLVEHGVPVAAVYTDNQGINTFATARAAATLMHEKNWKSSMLVSQFFHIARFQLAMKKFGVEPVGHVHSTDYEIRDAYSLTREVFAYFEYTFSNPQVQ